MLYNQVQNNKNVIPASDFLKAFLHRKSLFYQGLAK